MTRLRLTFPFGLVLAFALLLLGCDSGGDNAPPLDGDLSYRVEGQEGLSVQISQETWDGENYSFSTVESVELSGGSASGDLEDGNYEGVAVQASPINTSGDVTLTLQLLSNGEVVDETSEPDENGIWIIREGEFPDLGDL